MEGLTLKARARDAGRARRTRREGLVPAVVYGREKEGRVIAIEAPQVTRLLKTAGARGMLTLDVEGDPARTVMLKEVQRDPVKGDVLHLDFYEVSLTEKVTARVPVRLVGDDNLPGGSVLQHQMYEVEVECLPQDIPDYLEADVSRLQVGQSLVVGDLAPGQDIRILNEPEQVLASLLVSRTAADAAAAAAPGEADEAGEEGEPGTEAAGDAVAETGEAQDQQAG